MISAELGATLTNQRPVSDACKLRSEVYMYKIVSHHKSCYLFQYFQKLLQDIHTLNTTSIDIDQC